MVSVLVVSAVCWFAADAEMLMLLDDFRFLVMLVINFTVFKI
jgi:hypothetical protein